MTPMMQQYLELKERYGDCLLFFRLGDFYEMFFEDAVTASRELELVLTGRDCGLKERAPMCGVPYQSVNGYINKLIEKGYSNIVCVQPFGCLPNHIVGKGMIRAMNEQYKEANICAIDYDPGATRVNQQNRIKLMLSIARENMQAQSS